MKGIDIMPETKEMRSQRLTAIEKFEKEVEVTFRAWQDAKDAAKESHQVFNKKSTALRRMIREKLDAPLFEEDPDDTGDVKGARRGDRD